MRRRKGFTMIELMTVMLFIAALAAIAVPRFGEYKTRANVAAMQSDLGNLRIAQEEYWAEHHQYVADTASLGVRQTTNVSIQISSQGLAGGYTAVATHTNVPGRQCTVAMGVEAAPREQGAIYCGPIPAAPSVP